MMFRFRLCAVAPVLAAATTAFGVVVENDNHRVEFYESDLGKGRVAHIVSTANGTDFASKNAQPLWRIECRQTNDFTKIKSADASRAKAYSWRRIAGGVEFTYRDIEGVLAEVVCRVTATPGDDKIRWRITSRPAPGWATYDTAFPIIPLSEALGGDPTDDCATMGTAKGGVNRYPMNPKREYWKSRHHGAYPGQLVCQFGAFYDPQLGGLYTAAEDNQGWAKDLLIDRWWRQQLPDGKFREGDFILRWNHLEYSETERTMQYDIVTRAFQGTDGEPCQWRDAADVYREWSKNQRWSQTKLINRASVPPWAKNGPFEMKFNRAWFRHPGLANRWFREYKDKRFPNVPFVIECEGWEKHGDWVTPDYFPCYPTDAAFSAFCADARKSDGHVWAWPGGHHWNVCVGKRPDGAYNLDYTEKFEREVRQHCCANPDGSPRLDPLSWLGGGASATLCPATAYGRDWWTKYVCCGLVSRGAELVQADQDVGAEVRPCWSRDHGHAPGKGKWMTDALRRQFEEQLVETRKIYPWAQFSFEEINEFYNDILCFHDYRNCRFFGAEWASQANYLNHEYVTPYQPGSEFYSKWDWVAYSAADGQMPRLPALPEAYFPMPLVTNGGFEEPQLGLVGFVGWYGTKCGAEVVANDCVEGAYSAGFCSTASNPVISVGRDLPAWAYGKSRSLKVTLALKTLVAAESKTASGLRVWDGRKGGFCALQKLPKPDEGWVRCELAVEVPADAQRVRLEFVARDGVRYLADDVRLFAKGADGAFAEVTFQDQLEQRAFAERWIDVYHANAKFLQHGRHLHPPRVTCEMRHVAESFRGHRFEQDRPSVFVNAYRAADGEEAIFCVNATDREQKVVCTWRGKTFERTVGPRELKLEVMRDSGAQ